jgi:DNA-directed RNA polymerase subunit K
MAKEEKMIYTKYEKARMIGSRALQLAMGAPFLIKVDKKDLEDMKYNPLEVAKREFDEDAIPIAIKRPYPDTRKRRPGKEAKPVEKDKDEAD